MNDFVHFRPKHYPLLTTPMKKFRILLLPLSLIYWLITSLRNKLFDLGILKSVKFEIPLICVGNITVGGTGKTPHIEYLVNLLQNNHKLAILSRGYKRRSKGFVLAKKDSSPSKIGDEPYQIHQKFTDCVVAVCESRVEGAEKILKKKPKTEIILLDDAFQHRHISPDLSILLVDYNRPVFNDFLMPVGSLRESFSSRKRAQVVVVTKTPENILHDEMNSWKRKLKLSATQHLFFTTFEYGNLIPVFSKKSKFIQLSDLKAQNADVLLIAGIANPKPLTDKLISSGLNIETLFFPDHYNFARNDYARIKAAFKRLKAENKIIITTEKDAVRMKFAKKLPKTISENLYYLPIEVKFLNDSADEFNQIVFTYAAKN
jgi:tetraacyldisaccharide 4'-kinase